MKLSLLIFQLGIFLHLGGFKADDKRISAYESQITDAMTQNFTPCSTVAVLSAEYSQDSRRMLRSSWFTVKNIGKDN